MRMPTPRERVIIDSLAGITSKESDYQHLPMGNWVDDEPAIYFIKSGEYIKIGWSKHWRRRMNNIQSSNPTDIEVLLVLGRPVIFEKTMHAQFSKFRVRGEWFRDCPEIREYIESREAECWYRAGRHT